jgi:hypothetical protein
LGEVLWHKTLLSRADSWGCVVSLEMLKNDGRRVSAVVESDRRPNKIDEAREERIQMEIVVDCYNESERYSGWICYLEDKLEFPFRARCIAPRKASPLKSGEKVQIMGMLDEDWDEPSEIFVQARWQGRELGLPLAQLEGIEVSNHTAEAIADWHYWCARGFSF